MKLGERPSDWQSSWQAGEELYFSVDRHVERWRERLVAMRRYLHQHPEPSGEEFETTRYVVQQLQAAGLEPSIPSQGVGAVVDLDLGQPSHDSPRIAIRADIDGLRLPDRKRVEWASVRSGLAHACGHDCHTSIVLSAALIAAELADHGSESTAAPRAKLRFLFQPAEESAAGAQWLVDHGAMQDVDAVLGLHMEPNFRAGHVGIRYGTLTAHCDDVKVRIEGRGGHAARPHLSTDPISAAAQLISVLHQNLPRCVDSRNPSVFTIGQIHGGETSNVIPDVVEMEGTLRTTDTLTRETLVERLHQTAQAVELATGNRIIVGFHDSLEAVHNDPRIAAALEVVSRETLGSDAVHLLDRPSMGGEDFSVYLKHTPGAQLRLGCAGPEEDWPALHSPFFDVDETALGIGVSLMLKTAFLLAATPRPV